MDKTNNYKSKRLLIYYNLKKYEILILEVKYFYLEVKFSKDLYIT